MRRFKCALLLVGVFLLFGCIAMHQRGWNRDKIQTAMLAARVVETRAVFKYKVENAQEVKRKSTLLAYMLDDGFLLALTHCVTWSKYEVFNTPYGRQYAAREILDVKYYLDGEEIDLVGTYEDVALFDTHRRSKQILSWGDSDKAKVGDPVMLIGRSYGQALNAKHGIISQIDTSEYQGVYEGVEFFNALSIFLLSAPANPGDSGGMVLNEDFKIIGFAQAISGQGMTFALRSNYVRGAIKNIMAGKAAPKETRLPVKG